MMKSIFLSFLMLVSLHSYPGDKGNMLGEFLKLDTSSLEALMAMSWEVEEEFYAPLSEKKISTQGGIRVSGLEVLRDSEKSNRFVSLISELISRGEKEMLKNLLQENEMFYEAFSITLLKREIDQLKSISLEGKYRLKRDLEQQFQAFWLELKNALVKRHGEQAVSGMLEGIDRIQLGYVIP